MVLLLFYIIVSLSKKFAISFEATLGARFFFSKVGMYTLPATRDEH